jgi:NarL family two-component system response regulator LiaR
MNHDPGLPSGVRIPRAQRDAAAIRVQLFEESELARAGLSVLLAPYDHVSLTTPWPLPAPGAAPPADITLFDTPAPITPDFVHSLAEQPGIGIPVLYSWHRPMSEVRIALDAGARGFLPKSLPATALVRALDRTIAGDVVILRAHALAEEDASKGVQLTRREAQILELIATGISNHEIAELTQLSLNTVKSYIRSAYRKAGISSRSQAVAWTLEAERSG